MDARESAPTLAYGPLDRSKKSIRLLTVLPGDDDDLIQCRLACADLDDDDLCFTALSYTWNHDGNYNEISCDGVTIRVGRNLWEFLYEYRRKQGQACDAGRLWIDALCIDQKNTNERNHQVAQMGAIYTKARLVIAWLGPNDGEGIPALDISQYQDVFCDGQSLHPCDCVQNSQQSKGFLQSLTKVLLKSYWSRLWIVQEFLLSRNLEIWNGPYHASYNHLLRLTTHSPNPHKSSVTEDFPGRTLIFVRAASCVTSGIDTRLDDLVFQHWRWKCTDKRDKVYGLLGLVPKSAAEQYPIVPDYSLSILEVAAEFIKHVAHDVQCLEKDFQLARVGHATRLICLVLEISEEEFGQFVGFDKESFPAWCEAMLPSDYDEAIKRNAETSALSF